MINYTKINYIYFFDKNITTFDVQLYRHNNNSMLDLQLLRGLDNCMIDL